MSKPTGCICGETEAPCVVCRACSRDPRVAAHLGAKGGAAATPPAPCRHLGAPTGATVECGSCRGKTRLKLHACALHGQCALGPQKAPGVACCAGCPDREPAPHAAVRRVVRLPLSGGELAGAFNCGLLDRGAGAPPLLAWRKHLAGGRLYACDLAGPNHAPGGSWPLPLSHHFCRGGQEDPRLFHFRGEPHLQFSAVQVAPGARDALVQVMYARLSADGRRALRVWYPDYPARQAWEKNWGPFEHDGALHAVHTISPHRVLRIDGGLAEVAHEVPWRPRWSGGELRGGAPPVRVGDEYYSFFHGWERAAGGARYSAGCYTFSARPPFRPLRLTPTPLLLPDDRGRCPGVAYSVIFPGGAALRGDRWLVACGHQDRYAEVAELDAAEVERALAPV